MKDMLLLLHCSHEGLPYLTSCRYLCRIKQDLFLFWTMSLKKYMLQKFWPRYLCAVFFFHEIKTWFIYSCIRAFLFSFFLCIDYWTLKSNKKLVRSYKIKSLYIAILYCTVAVHNRSSSLTKYTNFETYSNLCYMNVNL